MAENGKELCGKDMIVEFAKGRPGHGGGYRGDRDRYRGGRSSDCFECGRPGHFARDCSKRVGYRRDDRDRRDHRDRRDDSRDRRDR